MGVQITFKDTYAVTLDELLSVADFSTAREQVNKLRAEVSKMQAGAKVAELGSQSLFAMVGLPYSGKSTSALGMSCPIVCPDAIRVAMHGHRFIPEAESLVWATTEIMVRALFLAGHHAVVLDATNATAERRKQWVSRDWTTVWCPVETDAETCIERARKAGDEAIIPIIRSMAERIEWPENETERKEAR